MEIAQAYLEMLGRDRWDDWIALWHDEAVLKFPFAPAERPASYTGKHEILAYMRAAAGRLIVDAVEEMRLFPGQDPEVLVVELSIRGHLAGTNASYDQQYVSIFECREGLLWRYREYWNPLVSIAAYGSRDRWLAATSEIAPGESTTP